MEPCSGFQLIKVCACVYALGWKRRLCGRGCTRRGGAQRRARVRVRRGQWPTVTCHDEVKSLSLLSLRNKCAFCQCFHSIQGFSLCWRDAKLIWNLAALSRGCWGVMTEHGNFTFCSHFCSSGQSPWRGGGTSWAETALKTSTIPVNDHLPVDVPPTHTYTEFYLLPRSCRIKAVILTHPRLLANRQPFGRFCQYDKHVFPENDVFTPRLCDGD